MFVLDAESGIMNISLNWCSYHYEGCIFTYVHFKFEATPDIKTKHYAYSDYITHWLIHDYEMIFNCILL